MKKKTITYDNVIKNYIINDIAKIYCYFNKDFELKDIIKSVKYSSRTESGFESMVKMAYKMAGKTTNAKVIYCYNDIRFLMGFYKKGGK